MKTSKPLQKPDVDKRSRTAEKGKAAAKSSADRNRPECIIHILPAEELHNPANVLAQNFKLQVLQQQVHKGRKMISLKKKGRRGKEESVKVEEDPCFMNLCQDQVNLEYTQTAVKKCRYLIVSTIEDTEKRKLFVNAMQLAEKENPEKRERVQKLLKENETLCRKVVAFLVVADHRRMHEIPNIPPKNWKPVCEEDQLYLDVVCALPGYGCGQRLLEALKLLAKRMNKTSIALSSVTSALPFWEKKGFSHCPVSKLVCSRKKGAAEKRTPQCPIQPVLKDSPQWGFMMNSCV